MSASSPSDPLLVFETSTRHRAVAYATARQQAGDGWLRFVFEIEGIWYVSRSEPPYQAVKMVEAVIPHNAHYRIDVHMDA